MTLYQAILLGIIQGITEFLPISSSAHLVLVPFLLNWQLSPNESFVFDVLVQVGTLVAVVIYFHKDLFAILKSFFQGLKLRQPFKEADSRMGWLILLATLPAGLIGLLIKDTVEAAFANPILVAMMLLVTAALMSVAELVGRKMHQFEEITHWDAILIGLFQAAAIFPGISRSGATISGGLLRQIDRKAAARFSFLISIPVMAAAGLLALIDLISLPSLTSFLPVMAVGFTVSALIGYFSIAWLMRFLTRHPLYYFSIYCSVVAILMLVVYHVR